MLKNDCYVLSVIIPVYNCEMYLERASKSVLTQPCGKKLELLIVDDGSKDNSGLIADKIAEDNANVRVFHQKNAGVSSARNFGIDNASGKYIAFLDSDDWWNDGFFDEKIYNELSNNFIDIYSFSYNNITTNIKYVKTLHASTDSSFTFEYYNTHSWGKYNYFHFCSFIYNKNFLLNNDLKFSSVKFNEDRIFAEMCWSVANSSGKSDKNIFSYWSNPKSVTHTTDCITHFENDYESILISKRWHSERNLDYNTDYCFFMLVEQLLPTLCATKSYSYVCDFFNNDRRFDLLKKYNDFNLLPKLHKTIKLFVEHPFVFYVKAYIITKPICTIKTFLYRHNILRIPFDFINYRLIKKYDLLNK